MRCRAAVVRLSLLFTHSYPGSTGLADDVRYYGQWMRDEAERRIGHLYPKVRIEEGEARSEKRPGAPARPSPSLSPHSSPLTPHRGEATVIAGLWVRTVKCPNPACGAQMPLVRSFWLSTKKGKEAWVEPIVDPAAKTVRFQVRTGGGAPTSGTVENRAATCLFCGQASPLKLLREQVSASSPPAFGTVPLAIVAQGHRGRTYIAAEGSGPEVSRPGWLDAFELPKKLTGGAVMAWGFTSFGELFTPRQLVALTTFSDLVGEAREKVREDALAAGLDEKRVERSEEREDSPASLSSLLSPHSWPSSHSSLLFPHSCHLLHRLGDHARRAPPCRLHDHRHLAHAQ